MKRARSLAALVVLFLGAGLVRAQEWRGAEALALEVKGKQRGDIAEALVILRYQLVDPPAGPRPVRTDAAGRAVIADLAPGIWEVEVSHPDFLSFVALVVLEGNRKPRVQASFLQASGSSLTPIRVRFMDGSGKQPSPSVPLPPEAAARLAQRQPALPKRPPEPRPATSGGRATGRQPAPEVVPPQELRPLPEAARPPGPAAEPLPTPTAPPAEPPAGEPQAVPPPTVTPTPPPGPAPAAPEPLPAPSRAAVAPEPERAPAPSPVAPPPEPVPTAAPSPPAAEPEPSPVPSPSLPAPEPESPPASGPPATEPEPQPPPQPSPPIAEPEPQPAPPPSSPIAEPGPQPAPPPSPPIAEPEPQPAPPPSLPIAEPGPQPAPPPSPPAAEPAPQPAPPPSPPTPAPAEAPPTALPRAEPPPPVPAARADESAPAIEPTPTVTAEPPAAAPRPIIAAAPGPLGPTLRAYRDQSCIECRPGEWAISVEVVAGPASAPCPTGLETDGKALADLLGGAITLELKEVAAPAAEALGYLPQEVAARGAALLGDSSRACRLVAVVLPKGGRFRGARMEAADASGVGDCQASRSCPVGQAYWAGQPRVEREPSSTVIWSLFVNEAAERARRARLTVYFASPSRLWEPPRQ